MQQSTGRGLVAIADKELRKNSIDILNEIALAIHRFPYDTCIYALLYV